MNRHLVLGILAHVDAGKTTLSEAMLYRTGSIRSLGRVDHKDAFLDTFSMERARGITIFSKQAELQLGAWKVTLLDTPGHVDFSAEMERTLQVLDYAILVVSGADGVQAHTRTLWRLLKQYQIPVFIFVNKMDQPGTNRLQRMQELQEQLGDACQDFTAERTNEWLEGLALCEESLMNEYLATADLKDNSIQAAIRSRKIVPCFFGSALKLEGVEEFLKGVEHYAVPPQYDAAFGARVYKISRDAAGNRLTHLKITGGCLNVRDTIQHNAQTEKVTQLRIYSGDTFQPVSVAEAGRICAVTGLEASYSGEGLGIEADMGLPLLEPVLQYRMILPEDCVAQTAWSQIQQLEEEDPLLHLEWQEQSGEILIQVMGEVELEILQQMIEDRFGLSVTFGEGSLVYKETIEAPVEGIGHFEPLRHYAEVHLLLEPGEAGSGIQVETVCSEDMLNKNWQRLILSHVTECTHPGVLTGSEITDMKLTLVAGRASVKHTEGGDFRQATYRAIRQGLRKAKSILLEPYYEYQLTVPTKNTGRAMADILKMSGSFDPPDTTGSQTVIQGLAPVATMSGYQKEVHAYTHGEGRLVCTFKAYMPCHNAEEVIADKNYQPDEDREHPTGSVFCSHGAGFLVPWNQVEQYMHVTSGLQLAEEEAPDDTAEVLKSTTYVSETVADEDELERIFQRTYGTSIRQPHKKWESRDDFEGNAYENDNSTSESKTSQAGMNKYKSRKETKKDSYLLVDGYNIIFAWEELKQLSKVNLEAARGKLMDILCNYQGYTGVNLILVFDAYKVSGNLGEMFDYHNIHVVYTKEAETADQYIEKLAHRMAGQQDVTVATSDGLEQLIIWGAGAKRMSAMGLWEEVQKTQQAIKEQIMKKK